MRYIEITKREMLFSVIIICAMFTIGFFIGTAIDNVVKENNELYYKAVKINNNQNQFEYGLKTNIGNALTYGEFIAINPVSYSEINGVYTYISQRTERYTMHTRTVTTTVNGKTQTRTETYWTWDTINRDSRQSSQLRFLGNSFNTNQFTLTEHYIDTVYQTSHLRNVYYGVPSSFNGSILAVLKTDGISNVQNAKSQIPILNNTIAEIIEKKQKSEDTSIILFWVFWILLTGGCVFGFIYLDNRWLKH